MAVKISHWVWQHSGAKGNDLLVLLALADNANDQGLCWPSMAYLAEKTRLHPNTIRTRLKSLRSLGILSWDERRGGSNVFSINTETPLNFDTPTDSVPLSDEEGTPTARLYPTPTAQAVAEPSVTVREPSEARKRATTIPKSFKINDAMRQWAKENTPLVDVDAKLPEFIDYWQGTGKAMKDWVATWRNGMRKQQSFAERDAAKNVTRMPPRNVPKNDEWMYR